MVFKKSKPTRYIGRRRRRPKRTVKRTMYVPKRRTYTLSKSPIPNWRVVKLNYVEILQVTLVAAQTNFISLHKSSVYQPNYGAGGHQPMWFDQLTAMYKSFRVYGIKWKYTIASTTSDETYQACVKHQDSATAELTTLAGIIAAIERGQSKSKQGGSRNGSKGQITLNGYMSTAKATGVTKQQVSSTPAYAGICASSDPATMAYLALYIWSLNGIKLDIKTELVFYVKLFDALEVTIS